jgi:protoheme ferro-lyase
LESLSFLSIDMDERNWLDRSFEESEVLEVVRHLNGNKVSDLDGFSIAISQKCWEVLKDDAMEVFKEFHSRGKLCGMGSYVAFPASFNTCRISRFLYDFF